MKDFPKPKIAYKIIRLHNIPIHTYALIYLAVPLFVLVSFVFTTTNSIRQGLLVRKAVLSMVNFIVVTVSPA